MNNMEDNKRTEVLREQTQQVQRNYENEQQRTFIQMCELEEEEQRVSEELEKIRRRKIALLDSYFNNDSKYEDWFNKVVDSKGTKTAVQIIIEETAKKLTLDYKLKHRGVS